MAHVADRMSTTTLRDRVLAFGFGERTHLELSAEARGLVPKPRNWNHFTQTSVSFGQNISVTAVQLLQGISILASGGELRPIHLLHPGPNFHPAHIPVISAATAQPPSKPWFPWLKTPNTSASKASGPLGNREPPSCRDRPNPNKASNTACTKTATSARL